MDSKWEELTKGQRIQIGINLMNEYETETHSLPYKDRSSTPTFEYTNWLEKKLYEERILTESKK